MIKGIGQFVFVCMGAAVAAVGLGTIFVITCIRTGLVDPRAFLLAAGIILGVAGACLRHFFRYSPLGSIGTTFIPAGALAVLFALVPGLSELVVASTRNVSRHSSQMARWLNTPEEVPCGGIRFLDGKPALYHEDGNNTRCFNRPGIDPLTGNELVPMGKDAWTAFDAAHHPPSVVVAIPTPLPTPPDP